MQAVSERRATKPNLTPQEEEGNVQAMAELITHPIDAHTIHLPIAGKGLDLERRQDQEARRKEPEDAGESSKSHLM
jgi:hypothetical protein